ncbi:MAG: phytanoyl-CoA dioxygenase [Paenibacillus sp.]|nr:phytanoyl-CoA dioxygenase [Paenibacillus sp.]
MLTLDQLKEFDKCGFIKGDVILSDEEVERLREELDLVMNGQSVKKPVLNRNLLDGNSEYGMSMSKKETVVQIVNIWMASDAFFQHAANTRLCEEVAQLCRTDTLRIWHDQIQYKPPVTGGPTHWHQDHPAWPIIQPADLVSAWVALDDATIDNGCMWMVPGSHKWGNHQKYMASTPDFMPYHKQPELLPEGASTEAVPFEIKKGQVGYHHCLTWHGSPHNRSERKRRAIAVHYMPGHTRYEPTGKHPMEPHIEVKPGEIIQGDSFPLVYRKA